MSALPSNVVDFKVPRKPKVKEKAADPDRRRASIIPIRAVNDRRLHEAGLRLLLVICSYTNRAGITWVAGAKLARDLDVSKQAVSKQFRRLVELGYIEVMRKGWKGHSNQTYRVIFDPTVDAETAIAVTSSIEDTRPPYIKQREQMEQDNTVDQEGLKRIQSMIKGVLKPMNEPAKEYQMPKSGDTVTVAKMKREIAQAKARKDKHSQPLEVDNVKASHSQPDGQPPEVDQYAEERLLTDHCKKIIERELKIIFKDNKLLEVLGNLQLTDSELVTICQTLSERYQSEGLAIPASEDQLVHDLVMIAVDVW
jgi:DNA-binding transcriptional regulator YhcF (GntR family)